MGAVQLHAVEADPLGGSGGLGEGADDVVQVALGHRLAGHLVGADAQPGGADGGGVGVGRLALLADHADVPQLRHDGAARRVHVGGDLRPARELLLAVEARDGVALPGRVVADVGALGDDQADAGGRAAGVVRGHVRAGDPVRGERARHGRHRDAVRDGQAVQGDGPGQDFGGAGRGGGDGHRGTPRGIGDIERWGIPGGMCIRINRPVTSTAPPGRAFRHAPPGPL